LINGNHYSLVRRDRPDSVGGGVCLFYDDSVSCIQICVPAMFAHLELLCVDIHKGSVKQRFILVYNPPASSISYISDLCSCLDILCDIDYVCTIVGDFNMPDIMWHDLSIQPTRSADFINFIINNGFSQLICEPTRGNNILDLILTNDDLAACNIAIQSPFSTSDHSSIVWTAWFPTMSDKIDERHVCDYLLNFAHADYEGLRTFLAHIDWLHVFHLFHPLDVNSLWSAFKQVIYDAIALYVPKFKRTSQKPKLYPSYITRALNKKKSLWRKRHTIADRLAYKVHALKCDKLIRQHQAALERHVINSKSVSAFYNHVNKKLNSAHKVAPLCQSNGAVLLSDDDKADVLNAYFASVFIPSDNLSSSSCNLPSCNAPVSSGVCFSIPVVLNALRNCKNTLSSGPDHIPSVFWSKLANILSFPVAVIFTSSYQSSCVPNDWKHAFVTPVYKKGDASCVKNYRPISLTCTLCKVMESIVKKNIIDHVTTHNLLDCNQHGFLPSHSTASQLLECTYDWCKADNDKLPIDVLYIDFSKAFDTVSHSILAAKLKSFNFCESTVNWLSSFLSDRTQAVKCNHSMSQSISVTSGVPQGSVIGPILFVLFINDLPSICHPCCVKLYADDVKIYFAIHNNNDRVVLQKCLDRINDWAILCHLTFSFDKCQYLQIGYYDLNLSYVLGTHKIKPCESVTDLGVRIHSSLKPSSHCSLIAKKANSRAKLIIKCFLSRSASNFIRAFMCYVRPLLEYASVVWNPWLLQDINLIENVQRSFTRKVCFLCNLPAVSYDERLVLFNMEKLELRRLKFDLIETFKIIHQFTACNLHNVLNLHNSVSVHNTRGHAYKLVINRTCTSTFKFHFVNRIAAVWNFLPSECFSTNLISVFKSRLHRIDLNRFLYGRL
jgi:hypothetical protein